jgi:putative tricarboxylic transport membrane protein
MATIKKRRAGRSIALVAAVGMIVAACGGSDAPAPAAPAPAPAPGAPAPDAPAGYDRAAVMAAIDEIAAKVARGELQYDVTANEDEAIRALREVIPQPAGYPARSVQLLIGFGEGGGSDLYSRNAGRDVERIMGRPLVYNNVPGGSGEVALGQLITSNPDGYTIGSAITNQVIIDALGTQPYSFTESVEFIVRQQGPTETYWVRADSPFQTMEELLEFAKNNPGVIRNSGSGLGGDDEFRQLAIEAALNTQIIFIPFDGVGGRTTALLSGDIDMLHETLATMLDLYKDGQIRPLAYGGTQQLGAFTPDIPSMADLGYDVPVGRWRSMVAPKGTPTEIIEYLHNLFYAASKLPSYITYAEVALQNNPDFYLGPEDFRAEAIRERDALKVIIEQFGYGQ